MIALAHTLLPASLATPFRRLGSAIGAALGSVATRLRHRHEIRNLAEFDDRMLSDIGLTRSDLRDAYSEPLWHDPTDLLASRAAERRARQSPREEAPKLPWLSCETAACR